jgi:hypothetical protein
MFNLKEQLINMSKQVDKTVEHIRELQHRLSCVENNLQYIKVMQALKKSLDKFYDLLKNDPQLQREYEASYLSFFYTGCGFSLYDRVCNSILDYRYGNRPF